MANNLPRDRQVAVIAQLCEGMSIRSVERTTGVHRDTIMRLGRDVGEGYFRLHDEMFRDLRCKFIEMDEARSFVHTKQGHLNDDDPAEYGDQYFYVALDSDTKTIVSYLVGKRNNVSTASFALDLRSRVKGSPQLSSDGFEPYVKAVATAFGRDVDYAMLIKTYSAPCSVEAKQRYSPNSVKIVDYEIVYGNPLVGRISTSIVERQNLTLRMLTRRFTRLTNGFSKVLRNHEAAMDLYVGYYNLCWQHESLDATPAMAAGADNHKWTVAELVEECLERAEPDNPPTRKGSNRYAEIVCKKGRCYQKRGRR